MSSEQENIPGDKGQEIKMPVTENFSTSLEAIIRSDNEVGLSYFDRANDVGLLLKNLLKTEKPHIAIVGEPGTGKETLVKIAAQKILKGNASVNLNKFSFYLFDLNSVISGTKYRGQFEERLKAVENELKKKENVVLLIKDLFEYLTKDAGSTDSFSLRALLRSRVRIVTLLTAEQADFFFKTYSYLYNMFNIMRVNPATNEETKGIIGHHREKFHTTYSVQIPEEIIGDIVELSNLYVADGNQPQKSLSIIEEVCTSIELNRLSDPKDILHELKDEYDLTMQKLESLNLEKQKAVIEQKYEDAASLRNSENNLKATLMEIRDRISLKSRENRISIQISDIANAISLNTGISCEKILNREKVVMVSKRDIRKEYSGLPKFEFLQTQSILHGDKIAIKGGSAFVLMPFTPEFQGLFQHNIKPALEHHGLTVMKADDIYQPGNILSQIWEMIRTAEVIVVDVSGQNANVIFELGLCYGIQRCPILLTRDPSELPFNIRNLRYIQYSNDATGAHKLSRDLMTTVGEFLSAVRSE
jgi:DNA polymerase III delta prime subunit